MNPVKVLVLVFTAVALLRLLGFVVAFGEQSLQMDFAAFYTAGEAMNAGLSPYESHHSASPPIWDGVSIYKHSRFLYPPLVAALFQPFAWLPYHVAKYIWMMLNLVAITASLSLALRTSEVKLPDSVVLLPVLLLLTFHPLLTVLERGQIDGITLLLVTAGIHLIARKRHPMGAGFLIAAATLLKLHLVLIVPFLVIRGKWKTVVGFAAGALAIITISPCRMWTPERGELRASGVPQDRPIRGMGYSGNACGWVGNAPLPPEPGTVIKDGRSYPLEYFRFVANATLVRTPLKRLIHRVLATCHLPASKSSVSLVLFSGFFGLIWLLQWRAGSVWALSPPREFLYWQLAVVVIMLSAPMTWVMHTVWLVALLPLAVNGVSAPPATGSRLGLVMVILGLVTAGLPDSMSFQLLFPFSDPGHVIGNYKYVVAELAIAAGLGLQLLQLGGSGQSETTSTTEHLQTPKA